MDDKEYIIKENGDVSLLINEENANQFIPITQMKQIGDEFFETLKSKSRR